MSLRFSEILWSLPLDASEELMLPTTPQQRRISHLSKAFPGDWKPRLTASIPPDIDIEKLLHSVVETVNAQIALRSFVQKDSLEKFGVSGQVSAAQASAKPLSGDLAAISLTRDKNAPLLQLSISLNPGSLDASGLLRTLNEIAERYNGTYIARKTSDNISINKYLNDITTDYQEAVAFWNLQIQRHQNSFPLVGGYQVSDTLGRKMRMHRFSRTYCPQGELSVPAKLRSAMAFLWQKTLEKGANEPTGFALYSEGIGNELAEYIGVLGKYVPADFHSASRENSEFESTSQSRIKLFDNLSDFFPCDKINGRFHRTGFRFNHVHRTPHLGVQPITITELNAPLELLDIEFVALSSSDGVQVGLHFNELAIDPSAINTIAKFLLLGLDNIFSDAGRQTQALVRSTDVEGAAPILGDMQEIDDTDDIFDRFERWARKEPWRLAASDQVTSFTYGQLLSAAEQIDKILTDLNISSGEAVAICMKRRPELLSAILGVMRHRAFFVPLDADQPGSKLSAIIKDSAPKVVLCDRDTKARLSGKLDANLYCLPKVSPTEHTFHIPDRRARDQSSGNIAYVLYTSGTTGVPKGVEIPVSAVLNYLLWSASRYEVEYGSGAVLFSSIAFDMTITSLLVPLISGKAVFLIPEDDMGSLASFLRTTERLSFLKMTPSALNLLSQMLSGEDIRRGTRHIVLGGERLDASSLKHLPPRDDLKITNEYGPTETTVGSIAFTFNAGEIIEDTIPIGTPIWNTSIAIAGTDGKAVAKGTQGEIIIGGAGVARGYKNRALETSARFREFPSLGTGIWYATGDLGYLRDDGQLVYQGRNDDQVKIHGYRVELGDVENTIVKCPGVDAVAVVAALHQDTNNLFLSAFVAAEKLLLPLAVETLQQWVHDNLPNYARPDRIEILDKIPLAPSGKVDRKWLIARSNTPISDAPIASGYLNGHEETLLAVWQKVLARAPTHENESFFAAGGDSIKALHFVVAAREKGIHLTIADVLNRRTFKRIVDASRNERVTREGDARVKGSIQLSPAQRAYLGLNRENQDHWYLYWLFSPEREIDQSELAHAAAGVRNQHPALRARFYRAESSDWKCEVCEFVGAEPITFIDLSTASDSDLEKAALEEIHRIGKSLSLEKGAVAMLCQMYLGPARGQYLVWIGHHLILDMVSLQIMSQKTLKLYDQKTRKNNITDDNYLHWLTKYEAGDAIHFPASGLGKAERLNHIHGRFVNENITGRDIAENRAAPSLIVTAIFRSLKRVNGFISEDVICVERHGRGQDDDDLDLADTVGWLTSYQLLAEPSGPFTTMRSIESVHSQLVSPRFEGARGKLPNIGFNYLGSGNARATRLLPAQFSSFSADSDEANLLFPLEIVASIEQNKLLSSFAFDTNRYTKRSIKELINVFDEELAHVLSAWKGEGAQLSAFPTATISKADLSRILSEFEE